MEIVILLYKGFTPLDVVGPYEVLSRLPGANVKFAAKEKGIIESENSSLKMLATHALKEITSADILMIPGSTTAFLHARLDSELLQQIIRIDHTTSWTVAVCTGSILLAAAGLLNGKIATSHWAALDILAGYKVQAEKERFIQQGKIITAAGVSAGLDMALYLAALIENESYAKMLQMVIEYYPRPPFNIQCLSQVPGEVRMAAGNYFKNEMLKSGVAMIAK